MAALVVAVDQITKHWAVNELSDGHRIHVVGSLQFRLAHNTGIAFSQGEGLGPLVGVFGLVAVTVLLVFVGRSRTTWRGLPIGAVVGGAIGNLIDRAFRGDGWLRGGVVDFIDLQWWPIFNVADIGIVLGGVAIVVGGLFGNDEHDHADAAGSAAGPTDSTATERE